MGRLRRLVPTKPGEGLVTALMFTYIFGVLFFYYVLDPLRKGLFLKSFPSSQLPYAYVLTALIAGTIATLMFKLGRRWPAITLITAINLGIIGTLFYFRWAMGRGYWYLPWIYFFYVKTVSVLSTAQFWLLAGYIYDSRQAKRIYGLLGLGAILGAIAGSFVPGFLSKRLSTESMIVVCIAVCSLLVLLSQIAWKYRKTDTAVKPRVSAGEEPKDRLRDIWPAIFGSPHLRMLSALIFLTLIASQIADWQLDDRAQRVYEKDQAQISEFFGQFSFVTNILALAVQVLLTGPIVKRAGVLATITLLPACLFLSSGAFLFFPSILTASLPRGSDTVFRYSLNRVGIEMLYLPLAPALRTRLKLFVDVFVDRTGRAVAGIVILLFASSYFPFGSRGTAVVTMGLTFVCVLICIKLGRTYVNAFRQQLTRREVELEDVSHYVTDPAGVQLLVDALKATTDRQVLYALQLLQSVRNVDFSAQLLPLLGHPSAHIREAAVRTLHALPEDHTAEAERLLEDASDGVRMAAISYLCSNDATGSLARLDSLLHDDRAVIRIAAARYAAANDANGFEPSAEFVSRLCETQGQYAAEARAAAATLSTRLPANEALGFLARLIEDPDSDVAAAAARAAGAAGHLRLAFSVAAMLATGKRRAAGRSGLLCYGERVVGTLGDLLDDKNGDLAMRREIPWVLARIPVQRSVDLLSAHISSEDSELRFRSVRALNHLHETATHLQLPREILEAAIRREIQTYYEALSMRRTFDLADDGRPPGLLSRALHERMDQRLEIIFRLLGLEHPRKDMYFAYVALKGRYADRRTAAIEFLDNVLSRSLKPLVLPLLEESSTDALLDRARRTFKIQNASPNEALRKLLTQTDAWLKSCALHEIGEQRIAELAESCRTLVGEKDPLVRQTAAWALARFDSGAEPNDDD